MLKDESLVHYEASFCYDAFQFCVLVRTIPPFDADTVPVLISGPKGVRLYKRQGVDTQGLGGLAVHVRLRQ